ncbi:MAG: CcmD family protein [Cytophaga sp.]|uniref:CcmD family protein n=1 Tax=Cytophaga sp. TaxID=29535 RepID=UPI003F7F9B3B
MLQKIYWMLSLLVFTSISALAQQSNEPEMADKFRADGKIYVVVTVVAIILVGLLVYMISLDKKIGKLEKENSEQ